MRKPSEKWGGVTASVAPDDPEQFQRFVEMARELGADTPEAVEATERALRRMLPPREPGKPVERPAAGPKPKRIYQRKKNTPQDGAALGL